MKGAHAYGRLLLILFAITGASSLQAQSEAPRELVKGVFASTRSINAQTTELLPKARNFEFKIQHRFGAFTTDRSAYMQFLGLDLPANIRFGFAYAFSNGFNAEIGRTKDGKVWDLGGKVALLRQTAGAGMPVSVVACASAAVMTDDFPAVGTNTYFADRSTPFKYEFAHRLSYAVQFVASRRFTDRFSIQVASVATYHNLAAEGRENLTLAVPLSARVKSGRRSSILFEYAPVALNRRPEGHLDPWSVAYEVATTGHVFQLVLSSSTELVEQRLYWDPPEAYDEGYVVLGFNITRVLWAKRKKKVE